MGGLVCIWRNDYEPPLSHVRTPQSRRNLGGGGGGIPPSTGPVAQITINGGAVSTLAQNITLNFSNYSNVTEVIISENSAFSGATYQPIASSIPFTLSAGYGQKFIYVKLRNASTTGNVITLIVDYVSVLPPSDEAAARAARVAALPVPVHSLVKLVSDNNSVTQYDSTVYYVSADGYRHAFPNPKVFFSWFCDFSLVKTISASAMSSMALGKNITYRPGSVPVKFTTVAKVYAVEKNGLLRWITTAEIGAQLYGNNWTTKIEDINDAFFTNYYFGTDITDAAQYNALAEQSDVRYPSDSMGISGYVPQTSGTALVCPLSAINIGPYIFPLTFRFTYNFYPGSADGVAVRYLQDFLRLQGTDIYPEGIVNGTYGSLTTAAVKRFQTRYGIEANGSVGPETRAKINSIIEGVAAGYLSTASVRSTGRLADAPTSSPADEPSSLSDTVPTYHYAGTESLPPTPVNTVEAVKSQITKLKWYQWLGQEIINFFSNLKV